MKYSCFELLSRHLALFFRIFQVWLRTLKTFFSPVPLADSRSGLPPRRAQEQRLEDIQKAGRRRRQRAVLEAQDADTADE